MNDKTSMKISCTFYKFNLCVLVLDRTTFTVQKVKLQLSAATVAYFNKNKSI